MKPSVAFIGLGVMGHRMLSQMTAHGGFNFAVAWDPNASSCADVKKEYPSIKISDTAADAITDPDVHVVYIASPPQSHKEYATLAAQSGKAVFCEKPLGVSVADSQLLVDEVEATGVANAVNFPFIDSKAINLIQEKIGDGTVGDILGVDLRLQFSSWPRGWQHSAAWLTQRKEGGYIREVGSHYVFLVEKLFGPADLVDASVRYQTDETLCETHFMAQLDCNNIPISFAGGAGGVGPDQVEFTIWGSKTSYRLWDWVNLKSTTGDAWQDVELHHTDARLDGNIRVLDNFLRMLKGEPHTMAPLRAALSVQEIIEDILQ